MANADGWVIWYNRRWYEYTGVSPAELEGWGWQSVHSPQSLPQVMERWQTSIAGGQPFEMVFPLRGADGVFRPFLTRIMPVHNRDGSVERWFGTNTDITDQIRVEESLRKTAEWLRLAHEASHSGAWEWNLETHGTAWSEELWKLYGIEPQSCIPSRAAWFAVIHPDDRNAAARAVEEAIEHGTNLNLEYRLNDARGNRWILSRGRPVKTDEGRVTRYLGIAIDITERKEAEAALQRSEQLYRAIGESIDYGVWVCDPEGRNTYASDSFLKLMGLTQEQCASFGWIDALHPDDRVRTRAAWEACVFSGHQWDFEHRFRGADGRLHPILARGLPIRDQQGAITCWAGINLDISALKMTERALRQSRAELEARVVERTAELSAINQALLSEIAERARAEKARHESEAAFRALAESVPQLVWMCTPDGMNIYTNRRWLEYTGLTHEQSRGFGWIVAFHPDDQQAATTAWNEAVASGGLYRIESRVLRADRSSRWFLNKALPMRDGEGRIIKWFGTCTDIDDLKRAQEEQAQALQEKEMLLKEVHHRVKNNLQIISNLLSLQSDALSEDGRRALADSRRRVESMALVHEQLYRVQDPGQVNFADYTTRLVKDLTGTCDQSNPLFDLSLMVEDVMLAADQAIPCGLILNELITNALKYAFVDGRRGKLEVKLQLEQDGCVALTVADNGVGLPVGFHWTKAPSLGLRIAQTLARQLEGTLSYEGKEGTSFRLTFQQASHGRDHRAVLSS